MRINKYLAKAGIASRRKAEELILEGKVSINDKVIQELGTIVEEGDIVKFNNRVVKPIDEHIYLLLNKPVGYVSTVEDPYADKVVLDLIDFKNRIYPVGRLDKDSRGLLILTNDGEITHKLTHPSNDFPKTYMVKLNSMPAEKDLKKLESGIMIDGSLTKKAKIKKISDFQYKITITEGRNRQVRKMFKHIGCKVIDLNRIAIGNIRGNGLKEGEYRALSKKEINYLRSI
ncbi:pseudouridine synthase [Miniphocaeibacter halophilus]|uniref:rRNA pseudouridine synthase n=1 Tax=Miniphocaeibacter halophilus TaxID=2931922 RepID=A0AC61MRR8_9FIRM|nr:pseudouridine synthase [Miniphocaeibacter halophilus]QQK07559.1 rRNA pseudouridine synthase [Miniphocaeibacter halophilus]